MTKNIQLNEKMAILIQEDIKKKLDQKTKDDIRFSYDRVKKFAEAQLKNYGKDFEGC